MDPQFVLGPLGFALLARLVLQHRLKQSAPLASPVCGWVSVGLWFPMFVAVLALVVYAAWEGTVAPLRFGLGGMVVFAFLLLRFWALRHLAGWYHEAIAIRHGHVTVRSGPYGALRHPLHMALIGEMVGLALISGIPQAGLLVGAAFVVLLVRNAQEERVLLEVLGAEYGSYLEGGAWDFVDLVGARPAVESGR